MKRAPEASPKEPPAKRTRRRSSHHADVFAVVAEPVATAALPDWIQRPRSPEPEPAGKMAARALDEGATLERGRVVDPPEAQRRAQAARDVVPLPQVVPPRALQNGHTLLPPGLVPMAHLLADFDAWDEQAPRDVLAWLVAPQLFDAATRLRHAHVTGARALPAPVARDLDVLVGARPLPLSEPNEVAPPFGPEVALAEPLLVKPSPSESRLASAPALLAAPMSSQRVLHVLDAVHGQGALVPGDAPSMADKVRQRAIRTQTSSALRFYMDEPVLDWGEPDDRPPAAYPAFSALLAEARPLFARRAQVLRDQAALGPHPVCEMSLERAQLDESRRPCVAHGRDPLAQPCRLGDACLCMTLAQRENRPAWGYVARRFLLPSQRERVQDAIAAGDMDGARTLYPPGPCIECLLFSWTWQVEMGKMHRDTPAVTFNTFSMQAGQYAREALLETELDGAPTGIWGLVPRWKSKYRQYELQADGSTLLREVHVDFRPASSS